MLYSVSILFYFKYVLKKPNKTDAILCEYY